MVYDGATGESVGEVVDAHAGSIYSVAFAPDGKRFATASADKTVKVGGWRASGWLMNDKCVRTVIVVCHA